MLQKKETEEVISLSKLSEEEQAKKDAKIKKQHRKESGPWIFVKYASLIIATIVTLLPLVTAFFGSFKTSSEFNSFNVLVLPESFLNFENYKIAFTGGNMATGFLNTIIVLFFSLIATILTGTMTAYILNRFRFPGRKLINNLFLIASLIPSITMQMSVFQDLLEYYNIAFETGYCDGYHH